MQPSPFDLVTFSERWESLACAIWVREDKAKQLYGRARHKCKRARESLKMLDISGLEAGQKSGSTTNDESGPRKGNKYDTMQNARRKQNRSSRSREKNKQPQRRGETSREVQTLKTIKAVAYQRGNVLNTRCQSAPGSCCHVSTFADAHTSINASQGGVPGGPMSA